MTQYKLVQSILLAGLLSAFAGFASADIAQCVEENGAVTFTDAACKTDADADRGLAADKADEAPPARAKPSSQKRKFQEAEKARVAAWAAKGAAPKRPSLDVATIKAARISLASLDIASDLAREQRRRE